MLSKVISSKVVGALAVALVLLLGLVSAAQARQYAMSGKWVQRRGVAYIPQGPGSAGVPAIADAKVTSVPGPAPQALIVPKYQFYVKTSVKWPLPQPSLVQLSSAFTDNAPLTTGLLQKSHWQVMGTRPFANFAWCPGATANPACTTPKSSGGEGAPPGQGTHHGLIRYKAGTNQYGGTMQMLSGGGGTISFLLGATGPTVMHNPFGGAIGAAPTEAPGGAYANSTLDDTLPAGPITVGCQFSPYGLITVPGTIVAYGTTATWNQWGFPWTTGTIYISGTNAGPYTSTIVTISGSDRRNATGAGNITLVAGGVANGLHSGRTYMSFDYVTMKLTFPSEPLPSMTPAGIATGALLMVLAVGYALRRRF